MMNINKLNPNTINSNFQRYTHSIIKNNNIDNIRVIRKVQQFEKESQRAGVANVFFENLAKFADTLGDNKMYDLASIIYSHLIKVQALPNELKEKILINSLNVCKKQKDTVHILARSVDLGKLYKANGIHNKKYINCLLEQEKQLSKISKNPEILNNRFRTVSRSASTYDTYNLRLAMTRVDIAKCYLRTEPQKAIDFLEGSFDIFKHYRRYNELNFAKTLFEQAKSRLK